MITQNDTWITSMLNQETSFAGVSKKSYIEPYSLKTSETSINHELFKNSNVVSVKKTNGLKKIQIYLTPQSKTEIFVSVAVAAVGAFIWQGISEENKTYTPPVNTYQAEVSSTSNVIQYASIVSKVSQNLVWLKNFYENALNANTAKEIYPLISGISDLFKEKKYKTVNDILAEAELDKMSPTAMTTLVRTTYPARNKLSNWNDKVVDIKQKLDLSGVDSKKVLRGLI